MLYRVQPGNELMWTDLDASLVDLAREGLDLDRLEWQPVDSEHRHAEVVAIALRHGTKTETGIVFPARLLSVVERPGKLLRDYENLRKAPGIRPSRPPMNVANTCRRAGLRRARRAIRSSGNRCGRRCWTLSSVPPNCCPGRYAMTWPPGGRTAAASSLCPVGNPVAASRQAPVPARGGATPMMG
jgi:hypothetical protein